MAYTDDIEILDLYNRIVAQNLKYCRICLKTESETKLVCSKGLQYVLNGMKDTKQKYPQSLLLCYMCDARAASTAAFLTAVDYACDIKLIFDALEHNPSLHSQLKKCINNVKRVRGKSLVNTLMRCERDLKTIQRRNIFSTSHVLVVGSDNAPRKKQMPKDDKTSASQPPEIVISDEEEDSVMYVPTITPKPIEKLLENQPSISNTIQNEEKIQRVVENERIDTEPVNVIVNKPVDVPVNVPVNNNNLLITTPPILKPSFSCLMPTYTSVIHPIYQDSQGTILIPSLGGEIDTQGNFKPLVKVALENASTNQLTKERYLVSKKIVLKHNSQLNDSLRTNKGSPTDSDSIDNSSIRISNVVSKKDCQNVQSSQKVGVDWEDKIPMDVISFIDAQPNLFKRKSANRNICAIENVRSVR